MFEGATTRNKIIGINDEKMKSVIIEIYDIAEELQKKFSEAEILMANLEDFISCEASKTMLDKFNDFKTNFMIAVSNVQNYGSDLNKVRLNFAKIDDIAGNLKRQS